MMPENSNNQGLLSSWKEIASYLNCDERTCRRWEVNFGLPIHRMKGPSKSRVYAYKEELDAWRREKLNGVLKANGKEPTAEKLHESKAAKRLLWLLPILAVVIAAAIFLFRPSPGQPADFRIEGSRIIILDERGKELWVFDTGLPNLLTEKTYRDRFQVKARAPKDSSIILPLLVIKDINQDGDVEVLLSPEPKDDTMGKGDIYCFSSEGEELWHHRVGKEVEFGGRTYSSNYRVGGFDAVDIDDDGNTEIVLFSLHNPHSPSQLLILDDTGKTIGDFSNYGYPSDFLCWDLDQDGKKELLIAAMNDEYGKGCLIVLDPARVSGCSPRIAEYLCADVGTGSEIYYMLFPRTDVDQLLSPLKEKMEEIKLLDDHRIQLRTGISSLYFELDNELRVEDVKGSDGFRLKHHELKAAGKITSVLDDAYYEALKKGVLYWDGEQWTSKPTMNRRWNRSD